MCREYIYDDRFYLHVSLYHSIPRLLFIYLSICDIWTDIFYNIPTCLPLSWPSPPRGCVGDRMLCVVRFFAASCIPSRPRANSCISASTRSTSPSDSSGRHPRIGPHACYGRICSASRSLPKVPRNSDVRRNNFPILPRGYRRETCIRNSGWTRTRRRRRAATGGWRWETDAE